MKAADGLCVVEVTDSGPGFVLHGLPTRPANVLAGRGLRTIAQLADHVWVDSHPERSTTVRFVKQLDFTGDAPAASRAGF